MKKVVFLLLCIVLIIIAIFMFCLTSSDTYNQSAEEFFVANNKENESTISNSNVFSEQKTAEGGTFGQVTRNIKEATVTSSGATVIVTNKTNVKYGYTVLFSIEKKINNEWIEVNPTNTTATDLESTYIMPNKSIEIKLDWSRAYGELEKGDYRLVFPSFNNPVEHDYIDFSI